MVYDFKCKKYKVIEEYLGKRIEVNVHECWSDDGVEEAYISCPKYSPIIRVLGHKVNRLTIDDIHNVIFKNFIIAEKFIAEEKKAEHDIQIRYFSISTQYKGQEIGASFSMSSFSDKVLIICPSSASTTSITMDNNKFRTVIEDEIEHAKNLIDNGYVFPKPSAISKVKKKVKNFFNY